MTNGKIRSVPFNILSSVCLLGHVASGSSLWNDAAYRCLKGSVIFNKGNRLIFLSNKVYRNQSKICLKKLLEGV